MIFGPEQDRECASNIRQTVDKLNALLQEAKQRNIAVFVEIPETKYRYTLNDNMWFGVDDYLTVNTITKIEKTPL